MYCSVCEAVHYRKGIVESYDEKTKFYRLDIKGNVTEAMLELYADESPGAGATTGGTVSKQVPNRPGCILQAEMDVAERTKRRVPSE